MAPRHDFTVYLDDGVVLGLHIGVGAEQVQVTVERGEKGGMLVRLSAIECGLLREIFGTFGQLLASEMMRAQAQRERALGPLATPLVRR